MYTTIETDLCKILADDYLKKCEAYDLQANKLEALHISGTESAVSHLRAAADDYFARYRVLSLCSYDSRKEYNNAL